MKMETKTVRMMMMNRDLSGAGSEEETEATAEALLMKGMLKGMANIGE